MSSFSFWVSSCKDILLRRVFREIPFFLLYGRGMCVRPFMFCTGSIKVHRNQKFDMSLFLGVDFLLRTTRA